jgi:hypothetical protein
MRYLITIILNGQRSPASSQTVQNLPVLLTAVMLSFPRRPWGPWNDLIDQFGQSSRELLKKSVFVASVRVRGQLFMIFLNVDQPFVIPT